MLTESRRFHNLTNIKRKVKRVYLNEYPQSWIDINYKQYPRFYYKPLSIGPFSEIALKDCLFNRNSVRTFLSKPIDYETLSKIFYFSAGIKGKNVSENRFYPSAGARYPCELYAIVLNSNDMQNGVYHYNVKLNAMEFLFPGDPTPLVTKAFVQEWVKTAPLITVISSVFLRNQIKYGERGYRYALLEAGHIAQNLSLVSCAVGLKTCMLGGYVEERVNALIDVDGETESAIYCAVIGYEN